MPQIRPHLVSKWIRIVRYEKETNCLKRTYLITTDGGVDSANVAIDSNLACRLWTPVLCSPWAETCTRQEGNRAIVYGLRPGFNYRFRVFAGNLYGREATGIGTVAVTVLDVGMISRSVVDLHVAYVTETQVSVQWLGLNSSQPVVAYLVEVRDPGDGLVKASLEVQTAPLGGGADVAHSAVFSGLIQDASLRFTSILCV